MRQLDSQRLVIGEAQALQAKDGRSRTDTQFFSRCLVGKMHGRRDYLRAGTLSPRPDVFSKAGQMNQLLGDLALADKSTLTLLAIKQPLPYQFSNRLAGCHAA